MLKKYISTGIALVLAVATLIPIGALSAANADTADIKIGIRVSGRPVADEIAEDSTPVYRIFSGQEITVRPFFDVSGADVNIPFGSVKLTLVQDGSNVITEPRFVDSRQARNNIRVADRDTEYSITYEFNKISGGDIGAYPITFSFKNLVTPNGKRQPVKIQILDEKGNVYDGRETMVYIEAMAQSKYVGSKKIFEGGSGYLGEFDKASPSAKATPSDPKKAKVVFHNIFTPVAPEGAKPGQGEFFQGDFKVVETIPEGSVLVPGERDNEGWEVLDPEQPRVYTKTVNFRQLTRLRDGTYSVPIVLGFPNQPYSRQNERYHSTETFTATSEFFYNDGKGFARVGTGSAPVSFYINITKRVIPGATLYLDTWARIGRDIPENNPVLVTPARSVNEITAFYPKIMGDASSIVEVFPTPSDSSAELGGTSRLSQVARPDKIVKDELGRDKVQAGDNAIDYIRIVNLGMYGVDLEDSDRLHDKTGLAFTSFLMEEFKPKYIPGYEAESKGFSTAEWINANIRFDLYLTRSSTREDGLLRDFNNFRGGRDINLIPQPQARKVASGIRPGQKVTIEDAAGYYNSLTIVFSEETLNNTDANGNLVHALPLRNAETYVHTTMIPIREGAKSVTKDNSQVVATAADDILVRFSEKLLEAVDAGNMHQAKDMFRRFDLKSEMRWERAAEGKTPSTRNKKGTIYTGSIHGREGRFAGRVREHQGNYSNNTIVFRPNFVTVDLYDQDDHEVLWKQDPAERQRVSEFGICVSDAEYVIPGSLQLKNLKGIVLLPRGIDYVETNSRGGAIEEPQIINNYRNTGRQALIYNFGNWTGDFENSTSDCTETVSYTILVTKDAKNSTSPDGENIIDTWVSWDNNDVLLAHKGAKADSLNLNSNGLTTDILLHNSHNIRVVAAEEVNINKFVSADNQNWTRYTPLLDIDSDLYYKVTVTNNSIKPITVADIGTSLPQPGDFTTAPNENGEYVKRGPQRNGSVFTTPLVESIESQPGNAGPGNANEKFAFYYTTESDIQQGKLEELPATAWKTAAEIEAGASTYKEKRDAWAKVTAWRAVLKSSKWNPDLPENEQQIIPSIPDDETSPEYAAFTPGSNEVSIFLHARVENNKELRNLSESYASPVYKTGAKPKYQEGLDTVITNVRYVFSGTAFRDWKRDSEISITADSGNKNAIAGIQARLVYAQDGTDTETGEEYRAGDPVPARWVDVARKGTNGYEVAASGQNTTVTGEDGSYAFIVYKRGAYKVEFSRPGHFRTVAEPDALRFIQCEPTGDKEGYSNIDKAGWGSPISDLGTVTTMPISVTPENLKYSEEGVLEPEGGSLHATRNVALTDARQPLKLHKVGLDKNNLITGSLAGTVFAIYERAGDVKGDKVGEDLVTDNEGNVTSEALKPGDYYLEEKVPSAGYLKPKIVKFTLASAAECNKPGVFTYSDAPGDTESASNLFGYDETTGITTVRNKPRLGSIMLTKLGVGGKYDGKPIPGVTFKLFRDGKPVMDNTDPAAPVEMKATTTETGEAVFADIAAGTYVVKEISTVPGYSMIDPGTTDETTDDVNLKETGVTVTIPDDETLSDEQRRVEKTVKNRSTFGKIRLVKAETGKPDVTLSGAVFTLTPVDEDARAAGVAERAATTNGAGEIIFEKVPYGTWEVTETKAPKHYKLPAKVTYTVKVADDGRTYNPAKSGPIFNDPFTANVSFQKVDKDTPTTTISGATYGLYACIGDKDENGVATCGADKTATTAEPAYTVETAAEGRATFTDVHFGRYVLREITAPNGYQLSTETQVIDVALGETATDITLETPLTNEVQKGSVTLKKVDAVDTSITLKGVKFGIFTPDAAPNAEPLSVGSKKLEGLTGDNGTLTITGIPYGTYDLREIATIDGYQLDSSARRITLDADHTSLNFTASAAQPEDGWFTNQPVLRNIVVTKKGGEDGQTLLPGAVFELRKGSATGEIVATSAPTGETGKVTFANLRIGSYTLVEKQAPNLHQKAVAQTVTVDATATNDIEVTVVDELNVGSVQFTKVAVNEKTDTDLSDNTPLAGATFKIFKAQPKASGNGWEKTGSALDTQTSANPSENGNNAGIVTFANLKAGHYLIEETGTPQGYLPMAEPLHVEIINHGEIVSAGINGRVGNQVIKGNYTFLKKKEVAGETASTYANLQGAVFVLEQAGTEKYTATSLENGTVLFTDIPWGTYTLKEKSAPAGYQKWSKERTVTIENDGETYSGDPIINNLVTGTVKVTKVRAGTTTKLAGAEFTLQCGPKTYTLAATNGQGSTQVENVIHGECTLTETTAPTGYQALTQPITVTVPETGGEVTVPVENHPITGTIVVKKVGTYGTERENLQGVVFTLTPQTGALGEELEVTTDENGLARFVNVPYGTYTVTEKTAKNGYLKTTQTYEVTVDTQGETYGYVAGGAEENNPAVFTNPAITNDLTCSVQDAGKQTGITGATVRLEKCADDQCQTVVAGSAEEIETTENGVISKENLRYGKYKLTIVSVPDNYVLTEGYRIVEISADKSAGETPVSCATPFTFEQARGNVELYKADAQNLQRKIAGAHFKLRPVDEDGNALTAEAEAAYDPQPEADTAYTAISDENGLVRFTKVKSGKYILEETKAPVGYLLASEAETATQVAALNTTKIITVSGGETTMVGTADNPFVNTAITSSMVGHITNDLNLPEEDDSDTPNETELPKVVVPTPHRGSSHSSDGDKNSVVGLAATGTDAWLLLTMAVILAAIGGGCLMLLRRLTSR